MAVRWDAVVQDTRFWSEPERQDSATASADAGVPVRVQVWLFGALAEAVKERPVTMEFAVPFRFTDVIAELDRRYGAGLASRVLAPDGAKVRNCRAFVNGEMVGDTSVPIHTGASPAEIELIVLNALEGG